MAEPGGSDRLRYVAAGLLGVAAAGLAGWFVIALGNSSAPKTDALGPLALSGIHLVLAAGIAGQRGWARRIGLVFTGLAAVVVAIVGLAVAIVGSVYWSALAAVDGAAVVAGVSLVFLVPVLGYAFIAFVLAFRWTGRAQPAARSNER